MPGEWRQISSGGLCHDGLAELQTGPFESQLHAHDYVADGVAVVPTEAIRGRQRLGEPAVRRMSPGPNSLIGTPPSAHVDDVGLT